jgi:hypothetical protein
MKPPSTRLRFDKASSALTLVFLPCGRAPLLNYRLSRFTYGTLEIIPHTSGRLLGRSSQTSYLNSDEDRQGQCNYAMEQWSASISPARNVSHFSRHGLFLPLIHSGCRFPVDISETFTATSDNVTKEEIRIFQGHNALIRTISTWESWSSLSLNRSLLMKSFSPSLCRKTFCSASRLMTQI